MASLETALSRAATAYYQAGDYLSSQKCLRELSALRQHKDVKVLHNLNLTNYLLESTTPSIAKVTTSFQALITTPGPEIPTEGGFYDWCRKRTLDLAVTRYNIAVLTFQQRRFGECIELITSILRETGNGYWLNTAIRQKFLWLLVDAYLNISQGEKAEMIVKEIERLLSEEERALPDNAPTSAESGGRVEDLWLAKLTNNSSKEALLEGDQKQAKEILSAITPLGESEAQGRKVKLAFDNARYRVALTRAYISILQGNYDSAGVQLNRLLPRSFDEDQKSVDYNDNQLERYLTAAYLATRIEYAKGDMARAVDLLETCRIIHGRIRCPIKAKKFQLCRQNNLGCIAFCQGEVKLARGLFSAVLIEIEDALESHEEESTVLKRDLEFSHATYLQALQNFTLASLMCNEPKQIDECFEKIARSKVCPRNPMFWLRCAEGLLYSHAVKKQQSIAHRVVELARAASYVENALVLLNMMTEEEINQIQKCSANLRQFSIAARAYCAWELGDKATARNHLSKLDED
ncbi:hypothetical protein K493DRAFT_296904 [Basidiobolus meristosporus CBS 931.73]|uniref:TPR-like protein n=1 Tax=Basidiobolus meristosporus CBS 931.73 TaxID=1314790 RepID=A0A1Y1Z2W6_9FUNG|nr:hypothetical protein K493DRAFT_296904 [Basidiobolus meristosporus CBS 931.73]|eukprot:ORY04630.1 hypothetical protein K493DRAFT_296904 [Basidiobolus meristosporus CBS 931.73]